MKTIPPFDLSQQFELIGEDLNQAVLRVLASGRYIGGAVVEDFERQFAIAVGTHDCVACNSGTDALYLALRALKIGPGDEVITSPFTFIATAETISNVGAKPIFIDIDPVSFNLDVTQIAAAITPNTKAIIPVHLFGNPVDMTAVMAIAQQHNLAVIEDCAQATSAEWDGQAVGSIGHIGCFSFYPTKNLGACGDGGAITTHDPEIAKTLRVLRDHGRTSTYYHEDLGVNSRLDAIQAAILSVKLPHLKQWNQQRKTIADRYGELLSSISAIELPQDISQGTHVWNQYTIRVKGSNGSQRDQLRQMLQSKGVNCNVYYPLPLHLQPIYRSLGYQTGQLPLSEQAANEVLSLPMFPELTPEQQEQVIYALKDCFS
ncbi:MAG: Cys/Met metabolism pyridoxal-phosphate-dependent enzyme [Alkalinema sp. CACIAM 70d]|nr:MAG: Cys/Met metabolism pyridoxal-phosphate-dependent enzyme [Alkalinema sp. CACIAM 70d]